MTGGPGAEQAQPNADGTRWRSAAALAVTGVALVALTMAAAMVTAYALFGSPDYFEPFFSGWQVDAAEWGQAGLLVGSTVVAAVVCRRLRRAVKGRIRLRFDVGFVVVLVGLAAGSGLASLAQRVITWASDHTDQAAALNREARQQLGDATHPPVFPGSGSPAEPLRARLLLQPGDLGPDWYYAQSPDPVDLPIATASAARGELTRTRAIEQQGHWTGTSWRFARLLMSTCVQYGAPAQATAAEAGYWSPPGPNRSPIRRVTIQGVPVTERTFSSTLGSEEMAAFVIGSRFFTVSVNNTDTRTERTILDAAVQRALSNDLQAGNQ